MCGNIVILEMKVVLCLFIEVIKFVMKCCRFRGNLLCNNFIYI